MKKILALILTMTLVFTVVGCGSTDESQINDSNDGDNNVSSAEEVEISVWAWNVTASAIKDAAVDYEAENPGVKVEVVDMGGDDIYQKLTTAGAAGNSQSIADIVLVEDDRLVGYLENFPSLFANLSDLGFDEYDDVFPEYKKDTTQIDGEYYAMPWDTGVAGVFVRTDIFEEAGFDEAWIDEIVEDGWTWDDYLEVGLTVKEETGKSMIAFDRHSDDGFFRMMMQQKGVYYYDEEGNIDLTNPDVVDCMEFINEMYKQGIAYNTNSWDESVAAVKNGDAAAHPSGVWWSGTMFDQMPETEGNWAILPMPSWEEGVSGATNLGGSNLVLNSGSENLEAAYDFAAYFATTPEVQVQSMVNEGLFPSLLTAFEDEVFTTGVDFFGGQAGWEVFSNAVEDIKVVNYTSDYAQAKEEAINAQSRMTTNGTSAQEELEAAAEMLAPRTNRTINEY